MKQIDVTILIPCYNEEDTIEETINNAKSFLKNNKINGEVLVIDNNSNDNSNKIALKSGARVVREKTQGYGAALICGNKKANGKYIIMADADCSYDFNESLPFIKKLDEGYDLIIGNRFTGKIEKKAMPFTHKYIGNPLLSFIAKKKYNIKTGDFHCGLRAYRKDKILKLKLKTTGMEYASEMVIKASINNYKIDEVPITLHKDKRINTKSKLKTIRDGRRHLKTIFKINK